MTYQAVYTLGLIIYVIVTFIMWRNIDMKLTYKSLFCLLVVPIFFFGIAANLWLFDTFYPKMFDVHANARGGYQGGEKGLFASVMSLPIALAMSYGWYRMTMYLNSRTIS